MQEIYKLLVRVLLLGVRLRALNEVILKVLNLLLLEIFLKQLTRFFVVRLQIAKF